jgi:hypothetical protein
VRWQVSERLALSDGTGLFYQGLPSIIMMQDPRYKLLDQMKAAHVVAGIEYMLTADTRMTLEFYRKDYEHLPMEPSDPTLAVIDEGRSLSYFGRYQNLQASGKALAQGIEFLMQKKLAEDFYGLVSASLFECRYRDLNGTWRARAWDNRYIFSVIGGYKPDNEWEFSIRWNIGGGVPYTPFDLAKSMAANEGIVDPACANTERLPAFHSLNVRVDKRFFFTTSSMTTYLSVMNVYNRKNVYSYFWDRARRAQGANYLFSFLPVIGVEYEF